LVGLDGDQVNQIYMRVGAAAEAVAHVDSLRNHRGDIVVMAVVLE